MVHAVIVLSGRLRKKVTHNAAPEVGGWTLVLHMAICCQGWGVEIGVACTVRGSQFLRSQGCSSWSGGSLV